MSTLHQCIENKSISSIVGVEREAGNVVVYISELIATNEDEADVHIMSMRRGGRRSQNKFKRRQIKLTIIAALCELIVVRLELNPKKRNNGKQISAAA